MRSRRPPKSSLPKRWAPHLDEIQHQQHAVAARILRKSGELGLTAVVIPEKFGGMEMDLTSMMVVAEGVARDGSYSAWHGAHTGIGTYRCYCFFLAPKSRRRSTWAQAGLRRDDCGVLSE